MRRVFCEVLGKGLEVPDEVERIVSFSPAVTETLFDLGLGDRIAGVSAFCARPPEARKRRVIGSYNTVRPEVLRALQPDLIFAVTGYQREFALRLAEQYPVYAIELPVSVSGMVDMVVKVGLVTGAAERAHELAAQLTRQLSAIDALPTHPTVYLEIDLGGPTTFGAYSYLSNALAYLGARNVFGEEPFEWQAPDFEEVVRRDPDFIVYEAKMYAPITQDALLARLHQRGWANLRAVQEGRIILTPGPLDFIAHHGPSFIREVLPWLRRRLVNEPQQRGST